jgi:hypothetical protein
VYIQNKVTQFICLQMVQTKATVIVVNIGAGLADGQVTVFGPTAKGDGAVIIDKIDYQNYHMDIQENSGVWVWMNGDSEQNSENAQIALQQLSLFDVLS